MDSKMIQLRRIWTNVDGPKILARVARDEAPPGSHPIVLVHGFGVSSSYLTPTARKLAPFAPVYAPDFPGSGQSGSPDHTLSIPELADFLAGWMTEMGLDRASLLGNSFGCQIIAAFVLRHPTRIERAVLVSPTVDPSARVPLRLVWQLVHDSFRERPSEVLISFRDYMRFGLRRGGKTFKIMKDDRIERKLPLMELPTLIVRGGEDPIVSQAWAETAANLLPNGELAVIPSAAHAVNYDDPDALVAVLRPFLDLDRRSP